MDFDSSEISQSIALTIELASVTTVILLVIGVPLTWWLARSKTFLSEAVAALTRPIRESAAFGPD
ncbi:hypothetical protein [Bradyrhizobium japonicum]|uniref:hypothetical protein n=1 Tax=Bradyrhizobium japonicum TaxID=375 RepID=UPI00209D2167|nr:hypothetical protein [Bradyrhizobium japonicum]MCP1783463.1 molybdate transport system permease protein [Bradyrhizobium japonicum]MCP1964246.1 molybdate transport system permease protein [Bradyrhizobium japonicum]